ncbi:hypothetical protein BD311DRAFT_385779 [Dichomitus squalens]|uniref:Uncharacterized protein n=1 Tax=Dichomitus squalens TaxID=114155 RepID=A0A4Q9MIC6_9APHY|nr:hypothetical protein BD311DRAFT_385779 [Dichomitus squalens]
MSRRRWHTAASLRLPPSCAAAPSRAPPIISVRCIAAVPSSSRTNLLLSFLLLHLHHVQPRLLRRRRPAAVLPSPGCVSCYVPSGPRQTDVICSLTGPPPGQGGYYPQQPQPAYGQQPYGGQPYGQQPYQPQPPPQTVYVQQQDKGGGDGCMSRTTGSAGLSMSFQLVSHTPSATPGPV